MKVVRNFLSDCYNYIRLALPSTSRKVPPSLNTILTQFGFYFTVYLIICYVTYIISTIFRGQLAKPKYFDTNARRVLVVIAHPDDECMFFGPLIVRLEKSKKCAIYVLCLSSGDSKKQGHLRKKELWESCKVLGIPSENILLCCSSLRLDGNQYMWKSDIIAKLIHDYVESFDIDTVVTFDKKGVSGHQNHIALFRAVSFLCLRRWLPPTCRVFLLSSLGYMRSFSSLMDCGLSLITSDDVFILSLYEHQIVRQAMWKHKTQKAWHLTLYMCFSRYTYVNTFQELQRFQG